MSNGVTFPQQASQRIAKVVHKVEGQPDDRTNQQKFAYNGENEFLAIIFGSDASGRFSFNRVRPEADRIHPDAFAPLDGDHMPFAYEGDAVLNAAPEQNNNLAVPNLAIVTMRFVGYDPNGNAAFVFFYPVDLKPQEIPPHDHRDISHGGFCFSVFHPGTSCPQAPFAI